MCIFSFFRKKKIERNTKLKLIAYIQRHNVLEDVTNRISERCFPYRKTERKRRTVESERIIFRPTDNTILKTLSILFRTRTTSIRTS